MRAHNFIDLTGQKFGRLTVLCLSQQPRKSDTKWTSQCECGNVRDIGAQLLKSGKTTSCGCLKIERLKTHGLSHTQEHAIWRGIMDRCHSESYSKSHPKVWARYGGRGIVVDRAWHNFENFYRDMGRRPSSEMTIERKDNNGPYAAWNCVWDTRLTQGRNRRDNRLIEYDGKKMTLGEIMEISPTAVPYFVANARINDGWTLDDALAYPRYKHRPKAGRNSRSEVARRREKLRKQTTPVPEIS